MKISNLCDILFRRKQFHGKSHLDSELKRCLSIMDVMFIAIGHMIGAGIYVLTGEVVNRVAGPAIILSFIFAGIAALLSAFSYAEFGARFPRAGSAYTYSYVGMGEIWAFIVGWTVPLEYMIGNAAVARSWSGYLDNLIGNPISKFTRDTLGQMSQPGGFFAEDPDFVAFFLLFLVAIAVAVGSKFSANVNSSFVILNLALLSFIIVVGFTFADFSLWTGVNEHGVSRFFPYGFAGALKGSSACFFAFIGFEALATAGEEAKNPHRTIPLATFISLAVVSVLYILMSASLTLMLPYDQVDVKASFANAFKSKNAHYATIIISIGALAGMLNNLVTGAFALPRAVYAVADDGLIFAFFGKINSRTKTPLNATIVFTLINAILALVFDLNALVEFLSIGTLMAYSMVTACVILMRYQPALKEDSDTEYDNGGSLKKWVPYRVFWDQYPIERSIQVGLFTLLLGYTVFAIPFRLDIYSHPGGIIMSTIGAIIAIISFVFILGHEQNNGSLSYKVPLVPFIPALGLLINVLMMVFLNVLTWIRMFVWLAIGLAIYFSYGIRHSKERFHSIKNNRVSMENNNIKIEKL